MAMAMAMAMTVAMAMAMAMAMATALAMAMAMAIAMAIAMAKSGRQKSADFVSIWAKPSPKIALFMFWTNILCILANFHNSSYYL